MLGMFRNTSTANDKYPFRDSENLLCSIQMQLSLKLKAFMDFFVPFLEPASNFKYFETKDDRNSPSITEITGCVRLG